MTGDRLGPFEVLAKLGEGGMGEVYRAHDSRLRRDVALKILPPEWTEDRDRRNRLLQEARAVASLNHPNICTIHEVGEAGGRAFIAMELVEGLPLSTKLANGALSPDEVVRYGHQLADALAHAHDRNIVHRDFKSANVMMARDGRVKVLDFGLAKRVAGADVTDTTTHTGISATQAGTILGTVPYMAPEQLRGLPADARSDIWALGIVLYEMASGARPFKGDTAFELSSAILREAPAAITTTRVAPALQAIINRCLEKDPAVRYQRASEVRAALEAVSTTASVPDHAAPVTVSRRSQAIALAALVGLAAVLTWMNGSVIVDRLFGGSSPGRIESLAVMPLENLSGNAEEAYLVAGIHEGLITDLARLGIGKVIAKPSVDALKGTTKSPRDIGRDLGVEALVTGSILHAGSRLQMTAQLVRAETGEVLWANRYERNIGDVLSLQNELVSAVAREVQAKITPEQTERLAAARQVKPAAHDAYLKGRFLYANFSQFPDRKQLEAAIAEYQRAIEIEPAYAPPHAALSVAYWAATAIGFEPPNETYRAARQAAQQSVELDGGLAEAHAALGQVSLWYDWDWRAAQREIERALQLNPDSIDSLTTYEAYLALIAGQADQAAGVSRQIIEVDPLNTFSRIQAAWVPFNLRRFDESIRAVNSLLEVYPDHVWGRYFLALNYGATRRRNDVRSECARVMKLIGDVYHQEALAICAWALGVVGESGEARRLLQRLEQPPSGVWLDPVMVGQVYGAIGDIDRAVEAYDRGFKDRSPKMIYMKSGVGFDSARAAPRFQEILNQMNFPG